MNKLLVTLFFLTLTVSSIESAEIAKCTSTCNIDGGGGYLRCPSKPSDQDNVESRRFSCEPVKDCRECSYFSRLPAPNGRYECQCKDGQGNWHKTHVVVPNNLEFKIRNVNGILKIVR